MRNQTEIVGFQTVLKELQFLYLYFFHVIKPDDVYLPQPTLVYIKWLCIIIIVIETRATYVQL